MNSTVHQATWKCLSGYCILIAINNRAKCTKIKSRGTQQCRNAERLWGMDEIVMQWSRAVVPSCQLWHSLKCIQSQAKGGGQIQQCHSNIITSASFRHCRQRRNWPGKEKQRCETWEHTLWGSGERWRDILVTVSKKQNNQQHLTTERHRKRMK